MITIPLGDELVFQGPGTTTFRMRINPADGEINLVFTDTATGETWVSDTTIRQSVIGMERSRSMRVDWLSLDSENPFEAGGSLDTATLALSRRVVGRTPHKYDALWAMVFVGSATSTGALDQQYGAVAARIWDTTLDANGHAQGELRLAGNGFEHQGTMGLSRGMALIDGDGNYPPGGDQGYMGFGTSNAFKSYARRFEVQHITDSNNEGFRLHEDASGLNSHVSQENGDVIFRQYAGSGWSDRFRITKNKTIGIPESGAPSAIPGVTQIYSDGANLKVMFGNGTVRTVA